MSICIFWERPDGGMTIESPGYEDKLRPPGDTDEALIARCIERTSRRLSEKYGGVSIPHEVEADTLPTAEFIDAWEWDSRAVVISMAKARGLHMDRIRMVRDGVLEKLDVTSLRAQESGDVAEQRRVATKKQTLRDIPQTFDLTTPNDTPEELKAMWPAELA